MPDQVSGAGESVEPWDLTRVITRTFIGTATASSQQSKLWVALWVAATLALTAVLAVTRTHVVAYSIPLVALYVTLHAGTAGPVELKRAPDRHSERPG